MNIGTRLEVKKKFDFDESLEIKIGRQAAFTISKKLADTVYVQII